MEEPKDETAPQQPLSEEGASPSSEDPGDTSPIEQAANAEESAPATTAAANEHREVQASSDESPASNTAGYNDDSNTPDTNQPIISPAGSQTGKHRGIGRWLIPLVILILVGSGLFFVYRYGQTATTPATPTEKDITLLRIGTPEPLPTSSYPNVDDSAYTNDIETQAFEGLTRFYDLNKVGPQLALSWTNPDTSTWVFKLRPHVKFHTGRIMTATDVKASLDDAQNYSLGPEFGSTIKEVSVVDPLTVKITTNGPDPILPNELTNLYIYDTTSKTPNNPINGTGPYTLKPGTDIKDSIDLVAFDGYYGARAHVRELRFVSFDSPNAGIAAIKAGKVDFANVITKANADQVKSPQFTALALPSTNVAHLVPNTLNGSPLSKLAVRKALMQAIDIPSLLKARGVAGTPATQTLAPSIPGYDPALVRPAYNPTAAKKALADAGYPQGFSFTLTYYVSAQDLADEVKRQLALVGVTVKEDPQTDFDILGAKVFGGQTDMYYNSVSTSIADASDYVSTMLIDSKNYDNQQISQTFTEASQTLDATKRLRLLKQVSDMMVADRTDLPLYVVGDTYFIADKNLVIKQESQGSTMGIRFNEVYGQ